MRIFGTTAALVVLLAAVTANRPVRAQGPHRLGPTPTEGYGSQPWGPEGEVEAEGNQPAMPSASQPAGPGMSGAPAYAMPPYGAPSPHGGAAPYGAPSYWQPAPPCGHAHGCGHPRICGEEIGSSSGHPFCAKYPCARYLQYDCSPLPPISLSRYADNGDFDCQRHVFGDGYPHCPNYWFDGQPYAIPHDVMVRMQGTDTAQGPGAPAPSEHATQ